MARCFPYTSGFQPKKKALHPPLYNKDNLFLLLCCRNVRISEAVVRKLFCKKGVLKTFTKFAGKHPCQSLILKKVAGLRPGIFLWILRNFKEHLFFTEHLQRLLLAFARIEISCSNTECNKSAAEAWICLVSFYGAKDFIFTCIFLRKISFFINM